VISSNYLEWLRDTVKSVVSKVMNLLESQRWGRREAATEVFGQFTRHRQ
jgi:hypothetical protein